MRLNIDTKTAAKKVAELIKKQREATIKGTRDGINRTVYKARKDVISNFSKQLPKANKFTLAAPRASIARERKIINKMQAKVYILPKQWSYLKWQINGGTQTLKGRRAITVLPPLRTGSTGRARTKAGRDNYQHYQQEGIKPLTSKKGNKYYRRIKWQKWQGGQGSYAPIGKPFAVEVKTRHYKKKLHYLQTVNKTVNKFKKEYIEQAILKYSNR